MNTSKTRATESRREEREVDGLFCEEVLRDWLQNLEELIQDRDHERASKNAEAMPRQVPRDAHLRVVPDSGRGT